LEIPGGDALVKDDDDRCDDEVVSKSRSIGGAEILVLHSALFALLKGFLDHQLSANGHAVKSTKIRAIVQQFGCRFIS
jgi:hypothetical protein